LTKQSFIEQTNLILLHGKGLNQGMRDWQNKKKSIHAIFFDFSSLTKIIACSLPGEEIVTTISYV